jgi:hypothetical protein
LKALWRQGERGEGEEYICQQTPDDTVPDDTSFSET